MDSLQLFISLELIFWSYVFNFSPLTQKSTFFIGYTTVFGRHQIYSINKITFDHSFCELNFFSSMWSFEFFNVNSTWPSKRNFVLCVQIYAQEYFLKSLLNEKFFFRDQFIYFIFIVVIVLNFTQVWPLNFDQCNKIEL